MFASECLALKVCAAAKMLTTTENGERTKHIPLREERTSASSHQYHSFCVYLRIYIPFSNGVALVWLDKYRRCGGPQIGMSALRLYMRWMEMECTLFKYICVHVTPQLWMRMYRTIYTIYKHHTESFLPILSQYILWFPSARSWNLLQTNWIGLRRPNGQIHTRMYNLSRERDKQTQGAN